MKIAHIIDSLNIGGVEVGVISLMFSRDDYIVVCVNGYDEVFFETIPSEIRSRIKVFDSYFLAIKFLKAYRPDLVISSLWRGHFCSLIFKLISPKIYRIHFVHNSRFAHKIDSLITRLSFGSSDIVICDSVESKSWAEHFLNSNIITKVAAMNVSFSSHMKKELSNDLRFIYAGRLAQVKRLDRSIEFIYQLKSRGFDPKLYIYGPDSGEKKNLLDIVRDKSLSENVFFKGPISPFSIEEEMRKYNFYLQTSDVEGMSISVFQSIINGLLPIVTPVGEIKKYAIDLSNSIYVNSQDITGSVDRFLDAYYSNFDGFNIGNMDFSQYPSFSDTYFEIIDSFCEDKGGSDTK